MSQNFGNPVLPLTTTMSSHAVTTQPCQQSSYPYSADCMPPTLEECRALHPIVRVNHCPKGSDNYLSYTSFSGHDHMSSGISGYFTAFSMHSNGESGVRGSSTLWSDCDGSFKTAGSAGFPPDQRIDSDESWSYETNSVIDPVTHLPRDYRHLKGVKQPHHSLPAGFCLPSEAIHAPGYWGQSRELSDSEDEEPSSSRTRDSTCSGKSHFLSSRPTIDEEDGEAEELFNSAVYTPSPLPKRSALLRFVGHCVELLCHPKSKAKFSKAHV